MLSDSKEEAADTTAAGNGLSDARRTEEVEGAALLLLINNT